MTAGHRMACRRFPVEDINNEVAIMSLCLAVNGMDIARFLGLPFTYSFGVCAY